MREKSVHPLLHGIRVATPCNVRWDSMSGDERVRKCRQCKLHVYNLSAMSADDAEHLIVEKSGVLCIRLFRRRDGTVMTSDCPTMKLYFWCERNQWNVVALVLAFWMFLIWGFSRGMGIPAQTDSNYEQVIEELNRLNKAP